MIFESNDIRVAPGRGADFETAFARVKPLLLEVPGCRSVELLRRLGEGDRYQVRVGWNELEDHLELYPATAAAAEIRVLLAPLIAAIDRGHYEVVRL